MNTYSSRPVVLCLSGHDPSGGAGLQADIEALLAQGCHAAPTVTALTVQDTRNVSAFRVLDRDWVLAQAHAVIADLPIDQQVEQHRDCPDHCEHNQEKGHRRQ